MQNHFICPNQKSEGVEGTGGQFTEVAAGGGEQGLAGVGGKARESLRFAREGKGGTFLSDPSPSAHVDRHLSKSQKGLTNVRGNYDHPCVRAVRQINHSHHSSIHSQHPALGSRAAFPSRACWIKLGFISCAG